ncbi:rho GTPase-activating protein 12b isoform X6 [Megalobrama amblycephala]|uniref:rho GTPase-activating protein 12b isoform X6 n=1 Tax=Megalobrama amblycephala TaxID=75352 RepID=UPI0020142B7B|nr:rho GTPase-activating protein 12b isoform X6 [Megalobrama amblycephala]
MTERDSRCDLSIAPGQVYIEVEYDYEYEAKDRLISIRQGECYMLVRKTNEDWWQVRREEGTKAFYVPAQYVREVRRALLPPPKPRAKPPSVLEISQCRSSNENLNHRAPTERSSFGRPPPSTTPSPLPGQQTPPLLLRDTNQNPGMKSVVAELTLLNNNNHHNYHHGNPSLPRGRAESPPREQGCQGKLPGVLSVDTDGSVSPGDGLEKMRNDSESGDELSSSSTEHIQDLNFSAGACFGPRPTGDMFSYLRSPHHLGISPTGQGRPESPVYTNLQELKISQSSLPPVPTSSPLHILGDWETHKDTSGRNFYYNRTTQERTWKPPRSRDNGVSRGDTPNTGDMEHLSSEENCPSTHSSQSDSQYGSPPRGWSEELDEHGHTLYVSEYTNEKWIKHVDEQGRPYYYSADGSRSEWELPKYNLSPPISGEAPKSHSLERKQQEPIVLTKWRHSTYVLDISDKLPFKNRWFSVNRLSRGFGLSLYREESVNAKHNSPESDSCPSSPKHPSTPSEKCGVLNVTKITEHGKKVRKNWASTWTVLQGSSLLFAKGQGSGTSWFGGNQSKPEFTVDLRGGSVEWASKEKSSKKHVIELKTRVGTELLIQSEIDSVINDWFRALSETINTHAWESDEAIEEDMPESPGSEKHDKEKDPRDSKKNRIVKNSSMESSEQKKTRVKLKKFLTRRPTLQAVRDKGYIKDQVFGCSLTALCQREGTSVPNFVKMCIEHVENTGLSVDGLYRVSGNLAVIQKLRFAVNHDEKVNLEDSKWEDIHVTTGALKMFFRELPEPLFTYTSFNDFVEAIKPSDYKQRVQSIKDLIKQLPKPNQETMKVLFKHLKRVIDHGEVNRMTTQSVAIVFGPTLLRPEIETGNMAVHMVYQNQIVELILLEYENIFGR